MLAYDFPLYLSSKVKEKAEIKECRHHNVVRKMKITAAKVIPFFFSANTPLSFLQVYVA
ncbi:hypothetical protein EVA_17909 [gut metagenome]|uniref:Uncharacterized protein n=1 Tax=gut metagenome TaxID=749906 RepID=J9FHS6_9ZZZZ